MGDLTPLLLPSKDKDKSAAVAAFKSLRTNMGGAEAINFIKWLHDRTGKAFKPKYDDIVAELDRILPGSDASQNPQKVATDLQTSQTNSSKEVESIVSPAADASLSTDAPVPDVISSLLDTLRGQLAVVKLVKPDFPDPNFSSIESAENMQKAFAAFQSAMKEMSDVLRSPDIDLGQVATNSGKLKELQDAVKERDAKIDELKKDIDAANSEKDENLKAVVDVAKKMSEKDADLEKLTALLGIDPSDVRGKSATEIQEILAGLDEKRQEQIKKMSDTQGTPAEKSPKQQKIVNKLRSEMQDDLQGVSDDSIVAILSAIPDFLLLEQMSRFSMRNISSRVL